MKVEHTIHIEASPDVVWSVTLDVEKWPEWTPTVTSVERVDNGPFGLGSGVRIKQPLQAEAEWVVSVFQAGRRFSWETRRAGLHMKATHEISSEGGGTTNVLRVEAAGLLARLLWPLLRLAVRRALAIENRGLKARCEMIAQLASPLAA
jgi:carbon monoxide dehydrogenase subunit G